MSATLDASLYSQYFCGCPVLSAEGRTHPVQQLFLEEVYDMTGYRLAPDAPAALKHRGKKGAELYKKQTLPGEGAAALGCITTSAAWCCLVLPVLPGAAWCCLCCLVLPGAACAALCCLCCCACWPTFSHHAPHHAALPPGNQAKQSLIKSGWGDDEADLGPLNPHYEAELYDDLADHVRRNLARLDEEAIDMDLLEEVVYYIDTTQVGGRLGGLRGVHRCSVCVAGRAGWCWGHEIKGEG
jgi:hypothetical protein